MLDTQVIEEIRAAAYDKAFTGTVPVTTVCLWAYSKMQEAGSLAGIKCRCLRVTTTISLVIKCPMAQILCQAYQHSGSLKVTGNSEYLPEFVDTLSVFPLCPHGEMRPLHSWPRSGLLLLLLLILQ